MRKLCIFALVLSLLLLSACGVSQTAEPVLSAPPTIAPSETQPANRIVRISVTQMLGDSQMLQQLCDLFEQQSGYRTELSVNPDNVSVSVAQTGKFDLLIARDTTDSSRFLTAGYGEQSFPWVEDSLVLAGPADDPAAVADAQSIEQAFVRIAKFGKRFVSCYDDSDLNRIETGFWSQSGVIIGDGKPWYKAARHALPGALQTANTLNAYILSTYEGFLQEADSVSLRVLLRDLPQMHNSYSVITVTSAMFPDVNIQGAEAFCAFLQSEEALQSVTQYGTDSYGSPIYTILI